MTKERQIEILKGRINQCELLQKQKTAPAELLIMYTGMKVAFEDAIKIIKGREF